MSDHPSVLLCDSDARSMRALNVVLRAAGLSVRATQTAEDALTQAAWYVPDLAIIEMELIESSATEVCRRLREWSAMPLIVVSHVADEDRIVDAFAAGADDYITKPFRPRELVARNRSPRRGPGPSCSAPPSGAHDAPGLYVISMATASTLSGAGDAGGGNWRRDGPGSGGSTWEKTAPAWGSSPTRSPQSHRDPVMTIHLARRERAIL